VYQAPPGPLARPPNPPPPSNALSPRVRWGDSRLPRPLQSETMCLFEIEHGMNAPPLGPPGRAAHRPMSPRNKRSHFRRRFPGPLKTSPLSVNRPFRKWVPQTSDKRRPGPRNKIRPHPAGPVHRPPQPRPDKVLPRAQPWSTPATRGPGKSTHPPAPYAPPHTLI